MKALNLRIGLRCSNSNYGGVHFGFAFFNSDPKTSDSRIPALFEKEFGERQWNDFWHAFAWWDDHPTWNDDTLATIISGAFAQDLEALIRKLAGIANEASKAVAVATK
jgi:hypothetical protein